MDILSFQSLVSDYWIGKAKKWERRKEKKKKGEKKEKKKRRKEEKNQEGNKVIWYPFKNSSNPVIIPPAGTSSLYNWWPAILRKFKKSRIGSNNFEILSLGSNLFLWICFCLALSGPPI